MRCPPTHGFRVLGKDGHELLSRVHAKLQEHGIETPTVQVRRSAGSHLV